MLMVSCLCIVTASYGSGIPRVDVGPAALLHSVGRAALLEKIMNIIILLIILSVLHSHNKVSLVLILSCSILHKHACMYVHTNTETHIHTHKPCHSMILIPYSITVNDNSHLCLYIQNQEGRVDVYEGIGVLELNVTRTLAGYGTVDVTWQVTPRESDIYDFSPAGGKLRYDT